MKRFVGLFCCLTIMLFAANALASEYNEYDARCTGSTHFGPFTYAYDETQHWMICSACGMNCFYDEHYVGCRAPGICMDCGAPCQNEIRYHGDATHFERNATSHWEACDYCGAALSDAVAHIPSESDPGLCKVCLAGTGFLTDGKIVGLDNPFGKLAIYRNGELVNYTGFDKFEGSDFYFENGVQRDDLVGVVMINGVWYAMDHGRLMRDEMVVPFDGGVFYFRDGTVNTNANGLVPFHSTEGSGMFLFARGMFQRGVNGPWHDPYDGKWYYLAESRWVSWMTDIIPYNGELFFFREGVLAADYTGYVTGSDGTGYYVVCGRVVDAGVRQ